MTRPGIIAVIVGASLLAPLAPARADCTRVAGLRLGECSKPTKPRGSSSSAGSQDRARAAEGKLLSLLNAERRAAGLAPLTRSPLLASVARRHSARMETRGRIFHSSWIFSRDGRRSLGWPRLLGETVGVEHSAASVHRGLMDSPRHRRHLLRAGYRTVGIGVVEKGGTYWVTDVFIAPGGVSGDVLGAEAEADGPVYGLQVKAIVRLSRLERAPGGEAIARARLASGLPAAAKAGGWALLLLLGLAAVATLRPFRRGAGG